MKKNNIFKTAQLCLLSTALIIIISLNSCDVFHILAEDEFFIEKYDINSSPMSPLMKAVIYSPAVLLKWSSVADAASYDLQLSGNEDFSGTLLADVSKLTAAEYQAADLPCYGKYFWRMRTHLNDGNISPWFNYAFSYQSSNIWENFEVFEAGGFSTTHDWILSVENTPVIQDTQACDGFYAVGMGGVDSYNDSSMSISIDLSTSEVFSFKYLIAVDYSSFQFSIDGNSKIYTSEETDGWIQYMTLLSPGSHTLEWKYDIFNRTSENVLFIDSIKLYEAPEFINDSFENTDGSFSPLNEWSLSGDVLPLITSSQAFEGNNSVQFGTPGSYDDSFLETIVYVSTESILSFYSMKNSNDSGIYFNLDNSYGTSANNEVSNWQKSTYTLTEGIHSLIWGYDPYSTSENSSAWIDSIKIYEIPDFTNDGFETADSSFSTLNDWALSGDALPYIQSAQKSEGSNAVQFGEVTNYDYSCFAVTVKLDTSGTISFKALKSSNLGYLKFYIDNSSVLYSSSAISSWTLYSYSLSSGVHTLKWNYSNYYSTSENVFIDDIIISP